MEDTNLISFGQGRSSRFKSTAGLDKDDIAEIRNLAPGLQNAIAAVKIGKKARRPVKQHSDDIKVKTESLLDIVINWARSDPLTDTTKAPIQLPPNVRKMVIELWTATQELRTHLQKLKQADTSEDWNRNAAATTEDKLREGIYDDDNTNDTAILHEKASGQTVPTELESMIESTVSVYKKRPVAISTCVKTMTRKAQELVAAIDSLYPMKETRSKDDELFKPSKTNVGDINEGNPDKNIQGALEDIEEELFVRDFNEDIENDYDKEGYVDSDNMSSDDVLDEVLGFSSKPKKTNNGKEAEEKMEIRAEEEEDIPLTLQQLRWVKAVVQCRPSGRWQSSTDDADELISRGPSSHPPEP